MALTDRQVAWINDYMQHFNASRASRNVGAEGKSPRRHGARMKEQPEVKAEIHRRLTLDTEKFLGMRHETIRGLACIIQLDPARLFDKNGKLKSWGAIDPEDRLAVQSLVEKEYQDERGGKSRSVTIKLKNSIQAAQTLMKLLGWEAKSDDDLGANHVKEAAGKFDSKLADLQRAVGAADQSRPSGVSPEPN